MNKEKNKADIKNVKLWSPLDAIDLEKMSEGFLHFTGKAMNSNVGEIGIRVDIGKARDELPYIALTALGASLEDLDYTSGGAAAIPKPRQVKDYVSKTNSGVDYTEDSIPEEDKERLDSHGDFVKTISSYKANIPQTLPPLLKQIIVKDSEKGDVVLSPLGALGLTSRIIKALDEELERRREMEVDEKRRKLIRPFWKSASNNLGGEKPQNIGLICAVKGGPRVAGFAWHFPSPRFPQAKIKKQYSTIFRSIRFHLSNEQAKKLRWALDLYGNEKFGSKGSYDALVSVLVSLTKESVLKASKQRSLLNEYFTAEYKKFGVLHQQDALTHLLVNEEIPEESKEHLWMAVLSKNSVEKGWLSENLRSHSWSIEASFDLLSIWLNQLGSTLSVEDKKKISKELAKEIYQ